MPSAQPLAVGPRHLPDSSWFFLARNVESAALREVLVPHVENRLRHRCWRAGGGKGAPGALGPCYVQTGWEARISFKSHCALMFPVVPHPSGPHVPPRPAPLCSAPWEAERWGPAGGSGAWGVQGSGSPSPPHPPLLCRSPSGGCGLGRCPPREARETLGPWGGSRSESLPTLRRFPWLCPPLSLSP